MSSVPSVGTSYQAEDRIRELRITVLETRGRTTVGLWWSTREKGDRPLQGHAWRLQVQSPKRVKNFAHAMNLAAWAARRALAEEWEKVR